MPEEAPVTETPEFRRDEAIAAILAAGGVIRSECVPLAAPDAPHVVAAYRINAGAPTLAVRTALNTIRTETQTAEADLIEWTPEPQPEPADEEPPAVEEPAAGDV
jgi:non-ribosomal peptide synthetase component F